MKRILLLVTALLVGSETVMAQDPAVDIMGNAINPDVVTIYAYRPKKWGGSRTLITLQMTDLEETVSLKHKTYFIHHTDLDGAFEFNAEIRGNPGEFEIFTELGNVYYVRCFFDDKKVVGRPGFELVDEETATKEMKKLKPAVLISSD